jgi:hypothetical protein
VTDLELAIALLQIAKDADDGTINRRAIWGIINAVCGSMLAGRAKDLLGHIIPFTRQIIEEINEGEPPVFK